MTNGEEPARRCQGVDPLTAGPSLSWVAAIHHSSFVIRWTCTSRSPAHSFRRVKPLLSSLAFVCLVSLVAGAEQKFSGPPAQKVFPVALPNYDEETATRLQIFLDNSDFGPGKIDGKMG